MKEAFKMEKKHTIWDAKGEERARELIKELISLFGDDPNRDGLLETPKRAVSMFSEMLEGMQYTNKEIAVMFDKCFEDDVVTFTDDMVVMKDIPIFSYCEHHLALMYNMKVSIAYLPKNKVIGLSKIARIADMVGKRLGLQEKIGEDICDVLSRIVGSNDIAVMIEGEHSCMTARGIAKVGTKTKTLTLKGRFLTDNQLKNQFLLM